MGPSVTDIDTHCLLKFDKENVSSKRSKMSSRAPIPSSSLTIDCTCLTVLRMVNILDTDCNVIGTIPTKECPGPLDIAEGDDGLYVVGVEMAEEEEKEELGGRDI